MASRGSGEMNRMSDVHRNCMTCLHHEGSLYQGECRRKSPECGEGCTLLKWPQIMDADSSVCGEYALTTCNSTLGEVRCMIHPGHNGIHVGVEYGYPIQNGRVVLWDWEMKRLGIPF